MPKRKNHVFFCPMSSWEDADYNPQYENFGEALANARHFGMPYIAALYIDDVDPPFLAHVYTVSDYKVEDYI